MTTAESVVRAHASLPRETSTDRRAHLRAPLERPVLVEAFSGWEKARCHNVSVGGVALWLETPLALGKIVEVYFELPSGFAVEAPARVVRSDEGHVALRFLSLDIRAELALRAHCHRASLT